MARGSPRLSRYSGAVSAHASRWPPRPPRKKPPPCDRFAMWPSPGTPTPAAPGGPWRVRPLAVGIVPTLVGAPCVSVPIAHVGDLPVNLALIGGRGRDETLLELA